MENKVLFYAIVLTLLILLASNFLLAQSTAVPRADPSLREEIQWMINGDAKRPAVLRSVSASVPFNGSVGGVKSEIDFFRALYPNGLPSAEKRAIAAAQSQEIDERHAPGMRSLSGRHARWTPRGPYGMTSVCDPTRVFAGRISCMAYSPSDGMYLGAASGGLWQPDGDMYRPITDSLPSLSSGAVAVNPLNGNTIYYGTGDYYASGGNAGAGLYLSNDHGSTWQQIDLWPHASMFSKILIAPWDTALILAGTYEGLFKKTPDDYNWYNDGEFSSITDIDAAADGSIIVLGERSVARRSTDQGRHWVYIPLPTPPERCDMLTVAIAPSNPDRVYIQRNNYYFPNNDLFPGNCQAIFKIDNARGAHPVITDITPTDPAVHDYNGIEGCYYNDIAVDPLNQDELYCAGRSMIKTTDAGAHWAFVSSFPHSGIKALAFRPTDNALFAAGAGGVFVSTDHGATWGGALNFLISTTLFHSISVSPINDNFIVGGSQDNATDFVSAAGGLVWWMGNIGDGIGATADHSNLNVAFATTQTGDVFRTENGGYNCPNWAWTNRGLSKTPGSACVVEDPTNSSRCLYNGGRTLYMSNDNGRHWSPGCYELRNPILQLAANSDGNLVYAITDTSVLNIHIFQKDPGAWPYNITDGPILYPYTDQCRRVITSPTYPGIAYFLFNTGGSRNRIYKTSGDIYRMCYRITNNLPENVTVTQLVESPLDSTILWLGTDHGVFKSTDAGGHWWWWNNGMPNSVLVTDMQYVTTADGDYILVGTYGRGTYERFVNAPLFSLRLPVDFRVNSIALHSSRSLIAGDLGHISASMDGGNTWTKLNTGTLETLSRIYIVDSRTYHAAGSGGTLLKSTDAGITWNPVFPPPTTYDFHDLCFLDSLVGFAVGSGGTFLKTNDGGNKWTQVMSGFDGILNCIKFIGADNELGFACGGSLSGKSYQPLIYRTTDGGLTWSGYQGILGSGEIYSCTFTSKDKGFATSEGGIILRTLDGGASWKAGNTPATVPLYACLFADPLNGWASGAGGAMVMTSDGGSTWNLEKTDSTDDLYALALMGNDLFIGGSAGIAVHQIQRSMDFRFTHDPRWNLVSLPVTAQDSSVTVLYPGASTQAFWYDEGGYHADMVMRNGTGYWLKFPGKDSTTIRGFFRPADAIDLRAGWNLIGSISVPLGTDALVTDPPGLIASAVWGYQNGYTASQAIEPGRAYWIKADQSGKLILRESLEFYDTTGYNPDTTVKTFLQSMNKLTFTDQLGRHQTLFFSTKVEEKPNVMKYEAPPLPPDGAFDVRFTTNQFFECTSAQGERSLRIAVAGAQYPLSVHWELKVGGGDASLLAGGASQLLDGDGSATIADDGVPIFLILQQGTAPTLPRQFVLEQNYPNPFNPVTSIHYDLPVESNVRLTVYDVLGQMVTKLVDRIEQAGYRSVSWNAGGVSSGIYFYRLEAASVSDPAKRFTQDRKMLLLR